MLNDIKEEIHRKTFSEDILCNENEMKLSAGQSKIWKILRERFPQKDIFSRQEMLEIAKECDVEPWHVTNMINNRLRRVGRGIYDISNPKSDPITDRKKPDDSMYYVPYGEVAAISSILKNRIFLPILVKGDDGIGKTSMIENTCYNMSLIESSWDSRSFIKMKSQKEEEEVDSIRMAMMSGSILLIDDVDSCNTQELAILKEVLDASLSSGDYDFKRGFNILATCKNDWDSPIKDCFPVILEQPFPSFKTRQEIVKKRLISYHDWMNDDTRHELSFDLIMWADSFTKDLNLPAISPRGLCQITKSLRHFQDMEKALTSWITRYPYYCREKILDKWNKIHSKNNKERKEWNSLKSENFDFLRNASTDDISKALSFGANPDKIIDKEDHRIIHWAVSNKRHEFIPLLVDAGINIDAKTFDYQYNAIHYALGKSHDKNILKILINLGFDVNAKCKKGWSPLHYVAAYREDIDYAKLLIDGDADIHAKTEKGDNVVHIAAESGNLTMLRFFVEEKGMNIDERNDSGELPLHKALFIYMKNPEVIEFLLSHGADPNEPGKIYIGYPIHYAVNSENPEFVKILIDRDIDINAENYFGETAFDIAFKQSDSDEIVKMLKNAGAKRGKGKEKQDITA